MDARPPLDPFFAAFRLPVTVTPLGAGAVETEGFWILPATVDGPVSGDVRAAEQRRTLVLRRAVASDVPRESRVDVAEHLGGPIRAWYVDGVGRVDSEVLEVMLLPWPS